MERFASLVTESAMTALHHASLLDRLGRLDAAVTPTDRELLMRFVAGDEVAFARLVERHGLTGGLTRITPLAHTQRGTRRSRSAWSDRGGSGGRPGSRSRSRPSRRPAPPRAPAPPARTDRDAAPWCRHPRGARRRTTRARCHAC